MAFQRSSLRYGDTPQPVTPYQKAAQVWDERIGSARVQAQNWRLMALGSLGLSIVLAGILLWLGRTSAVIPYIVEVDPRGGARAVGPAAEVYKPSDAQIAFHLARFVESVRGLSIDPVVVRQSWLKAYDFVTDRAAITLNEYARDNNPFDKVGRETVIGVRAEQTGRTHGRHRPALHDDAKSPCQQGAVHTWDDATVPCQVFKPRSVNVSSSCLLIWGPL